MELSYFDDKWGAIGINGFLLVSCVREMRVAFALRHVGGARSSHTILLPLPLKTQIRVLQ
jgi:hypothetical protein